MNHTPLIRYQQARRAYYAAECACVHWDGEGFDSNEPHGCCYDLDDAQRALSAARKALHAACS